MNNRPSPLTDRPHLIFDLAANPARAGEGQCDCACAVTAPLQPLPVAALAADIPHRIDTSPPYIVLPLPDDHEIVIGRRAGAVVFNRAAAQLRRHFEIPRRLDDLPSAWRMAWGEAAIRASLTNLARLGLLAPQTHQLAPLQEQADQLVAWLHVTDRCNLRCAYCYLPHHPADMSPKTGRAAVDATVRSALQHGYRRIKFKYAGGEPTLRFPLVSALHRYALEQAARHGLRVEGVLLSNGTRLTKAMVADLQALDLRLMISLDRLPADHAQAEQRPYAGGRSSAGDAVRAVELALAGGLTPDISVTVSGRNAAALPALTAWLLQHDLPFSFNFYRENDCSAGWDDLRLDEDRIVAGMRAAFRVIEANLPRRSLLPALVDRANLAAPHHRTCGVGHNYLVFDQRGRVAKCQMQLEQPITTSRAADPLALVRADQTGIINLPVAEKAGCRDCEWGPWCTGGCPLTTYRASGRYDVKSPNCAIYKALYPEAVRLEGLRLLKYGERDEAT